ncbi:(2,3-dihydroxybenzoyl)adenylate synthase [Phytoactinopolyspora limicola]|uniref:(2,3-dihydroxybenzoyl)adenylate synthase n=1 Tax=Phytoactinopolyspora limicola TaxID=2715536 RepID=UPI00140BBBF7|nr:AMP-binding protein [Phytoactinopolyspora limicola]
MGDTVRDGFVAWPAELAAEYRAKGWWSGELLGSLPDTWAQARGGAPAVVEDGRVVTFGELAAQARVLASRLHALGLRGGANGDRVIVQLPNTTELIVLVLACTRVGIVPVLALPAHRETDLQHLIDASGARGIAVPQSFRGFDHAGLARRLVAATLSLEHVLVVPDADNPVIDEGHHDLRELCAQGGAADAEIGAGELPRPDPSDVALLLLSGGTTGTPKLIPRTHDDYVYNIRATAQACELGAHTTFLASIPMTHNFGLGCPGALGVLDAGGQVVVVPSPEPQAALRAISDHSVTDVAAVPAVLQRWMDEVRASGLALPSLRAIQVGGARLAEEVAREVGPVFGATLQQALGMAEGLINYTRLDDPVDIACTTQGRPVSPGDEIRVVDPDGRDVAPGDVGELLARGPYTIRGYWRAPEHNAVAFTPDGWYRSGDLVRIHASGNLVVEGRVKDVINRGGEKISAEEVENLLYGLPGIARAAVVSAPDDVLGERVAAVVVLGDGGRTWTLEAIRTALAEAGVAHFKIPERMMIVDELPLTKVGKVNKVELRHMVANSA